MNRSVNENDNMYLCPVTCDANLCHIITHQYMIPFRDPFQYRVRRLIVRSREVSKSRNMYLDISDRSEIWQTPRQHCSRCPCHIYYISYVLYARTCSIGIAIAEADCIWHSLSIVLYNRASYATSDFKVPIPSKVLPIVNYVQIYAATMYKEAHITSQFHRTH